MLYWSFAMKVLRRSCAAVMWLLAQPSRIFANVGRMA